MILITDLKTRHINNHDSCAHREEISFSFSSCFLGKTAQEEDDDAAFSGVEFSQKCNESETLRAWPSRCVIGPMMNRISSLKRLRSGDDQDQFRGGN